MRNTAPITSTPMFNNISITITSHPLSCNRSRNALSTRHALRMKIVNIVNIVTAKVIAPEIVTMTISSLIMPVPVLSVSPS